MKRKSANMLRAGKHTVIHDGKSYEIVSISRDGATVIIDLGAGGVLRRSPGSKLEVK